jgi:hypothetical protein
MYNVRWHATSGISIELCPQWFAVLPMPLLLCKCMLKIDKYPVREHADMPLILGKARSNRAPAVRLCPERFSWSGLPKICTFRAIRLVSWRQVLFARSAVDLGRWRSTIRVDAEEHNETRSGESPYHLSWDTSCWTFGAHDSVTDSPRTVAAPVTLTTGTSSNSVLFSPTPRILPVAPSTMCWISLL